jgi:hypothetical protein
VPGWASAKGYRLDFLKDLDAWPGEADCDTPRRLLIARRSPEGVVFAEIVGSSPDRLRRTTEPDLIPSAAVLCGSLRLFAVVSDDG